MPPPPPAHDIATPLAAIAARRRLRRLVGIALAAALAFAGVQLAAALAAWQGHPLPRPGLIGLGAAGLALALGLAWLRRQRGTRGDLAFHVDRLAGLQQRYGTAVEVDAAPPPDGGSVAAALRRAGTEDAAALDPARLVPLITRPIALTMAALAVTLAAVLLIPDRSPDSTRTTAGTAADAPDDETLAEAAREIARLLAADAGTRDDPYLAAIARALEERIATAAPEALRDELEQLLEHAADAYGSNPPEWLGGAGAERLAGLRERLDRFAEDEARRAERTIARQQNPMGDLARDDFGVDPEEMGREYGPLPGGTAPPAEIVEAETGEDARLAGGDPSDGLRRMTEEEVQLTGAMPSGAAMESGRGRSRAAGLGAETLEADDAFASLAMTPGEDVVLSAAPESGGRRIRVEVAPEAGGATPGGAAGAIAAGADAPEPPPQQRQYVPADRRQVTARYFARAPQ